MVAMVQATVEGTEEAGFVSGMLPSVAMEFASGALVSREAVELELDRILTALRALWQREPDQVMITVGAISARLTEMCVHLHRLEGRREWRQVRTLQCERILTECDRQFKIASRLLEVRRQDLELMR